MSNLASTYFPNICASFQGRKKCTRGCGFKCMCAWSKPGWTFSDCSSLPRVPQLFSLAFSKVLELRPECPYTVFQVAKSFNRFPKDFSQRNKAKELLLSAEKRAPKFYLLLHELGWLYTIILKVSINSAIRTYRVFEFFFFLFRIFQQQKS